MAEATLSIQMIPLVSEKEIYPLVDQAISMIADSGYTYWVGPSETTVEGDLEGLLRLVHRLHQFFHQIGVARTVSHIKIDYKPAGVTIDEKINRYHK